MTKREEAHRSRRVVIFGINYWPEEIGIAPYTTGLAEHLASAGWEVTVVTGLFHYPRWRVPASHRTRRRVDAHGGVKVHRLSHYVPTHQTALRRGCYEATFFAHGFVERLRLKKPDLVVGVTPSLSGGALAAIAAKRWRAPSAIIIQDLMANATQQSGISGGHRVADVTRRLESWMTRAVDGVAIVTESFRPSVIELGVDPAKIVRLRNWSRLPPAATARVEVRRALGWRPDEQIVLHAGNMGLKQGLENVVEAARLAVPTHPNLRFVLMGAGSQRMIYEVHAAGLANVEFRDPCPLAELPNILAAADVLLLNERATVIDMSLPSKLTSYFTSGRPVLAAVAEGSTAAEVRRAGAGLIVPPEHPEALLAALDRLVAEPELAETLGASGVAYAAATLDKEIILDEAEGFLLKVLNREPLTAPSAGATE